ncbi:JAB domain-containing protein [Enterococcus faecium]|nr:JAB domain-containing protein [Enterococcus faecium]
MAFSKHSCHVGLLDASFVHPREVYKLVILDNTARVRLANQHRSGDIKRN